jgi:hypothetical protein
MPSITSTVTAALAFLSVVGASPVDVQKRKTFTLSQKQAKLVYKNGPKQVAKTLRKYGATVPAYIANAAAARAANNTGTVPTVPGDDVDSLYVATPCLANSIADCTPGTSPRSRPALTRSIWISTLAALICK